MNKALYCNSMTAASSHVDDSGLSGVLDSYFLGKEEAFYLCKKKTFWF